LGFFKGARCRFTGWSGTDVRVVARGYHLWFSWSPEDRRSTPETIALHRLHWQSELSAYRENRVEWGRNDPRWREPIATVAKVRARPIGEGGVVARVPGAALDQVVVQHVRSHSITPRGFGEILLMRDRKSGRIHGVNASGRPVTLGLPVDSGWKAILRGFLLFHDDRFVYPASPPALMLPPSGGGVVPDDPGRDLGVPPPVAWDDRQGPSVN